MRRVKGMSIREYDNKRNHERRVRGVCLRCDSPRVEGSANYCAHHQRRKAKVELRRIHKKMEGAICRSCPRRTTQGRRYCALHLRAAAFASKKDRNGRKKVGICRCCSRLATRGVQLCDVHQIYSLRKHRELRLAAFDAYGGRKCFCCPETRVEFLTLDHENGDGKRHREALGSSRSNFYAWLKRMGYPKNRKQKP